MDSQSQSLRGDESPECCDKDTAELRHWSTNQISVKELKAEDVQRQAKEGNPNHKVTRPRKVLFPAKTGMVPSYEYEVKYPERHEEVTFVVHAGTGNVLARASNLQSFMPQSSEQSSAQAQNVDKIERVSQRHFTLAARQLGEIASATGPGGNPKTGQYQYDGQALPKLLVEAQNQGSVYEMENGYVRTIDLKHAPHEPTRQSDPHAFEGLHNTWKPNVNGAYCVINDAHAFGTAVYQLFLDWFGIPPIKNDVVLGVHYGTDYENAFWDPKERIMAFGDGKDTFYPLVSLDVVAHEMSHGFTTDNSNLRYRYQSGGINESFSDITGEAAEYYLFGSNDWHVGASIFKGQGAMRYFDDPTKDGKSIGHVKDYYTGMDVHSSSGVFNHAFYKLATTTGWTTKSAYEVFVHANQNFWRQDVDWRNGESKITFKQGAMGVLHAARALGQNTADVSNAFANVGIEVELPQPQSVKAAQRKLLKCHL